MSCTKPSLGEPQTAVQPENRTPTSGIQVKKVEGTIELGMDYTDDGEKCVTLKADGPCFTTLAEVQTAAPDLHKRYSNVKNLAYLVHRFEPGIGDELFRSVDEYQAWWAKMFEPTDFFERDTGYLAVHPEGLNPDDLHDPKMDGDKLVYFSGRVIGLDHGIQAFRNEVDFGSSSWAPKIEELDVPMQPRTGLNERAVAIFGGPVEGFVRAKTPAGEVFLAAKPGAGASPFVWRSADKSVERFNDWKSLAAKHAEAGSPVAATTLAGAISRYPLDDGLHLIDDAEAYKKDYQEKGRGLQKLRYRVDQLRVTKFTVQNWDDIKDPVITDGVLVAHFKHGDGQPARMTYDLSGFSQDAESKYVDLFTSETISDTLDGPTFQPGPAPLVTKPGVPE